jgi:DnaJ-class molecular chaperone
MTADNTRNKITIKGITMTNKKPCSECNDTGIIYTGDWFDPTEKCWKCKSNKYQEKIIKAKS